MRECRPDGLGRQMDEDVTRTRPSGTPWTLQIVLSLLLSAVILLRLVARWRDVDQRLYWEYGGRILGRAHTTGFVEWMQHRVGGFAPATAAHVASSPLAPYTQFPCEYPPGVLLVFASVRALAEPLSSFTLVFDIFSASCGFATAVLSIAIIGERWAAPRWATILMVSFVALWAQLIGSFSVTRFDTIAVFFVALGLFAANRRFFIGAGIALGLAASIKLWPAIVVPFVAVWLWRTNTKRATGTFVMFSIIGFALPHLWCIAIGTRPTDVLAYLTYLGERPIQVESLTANLMVVYSWVSGLPITSSFDFGSWNVAFSFDRTVLSIASLLNALGLVALGLSTIVLTRRPADREDMLIACVCLAGAAVAVTMLTSRVFSGEYLIWLLPFVVIACRTSLGGLACVFLGVAMLSLKALYRLDINGLTAAATLVCLFKNVCVGAVSVLLAKAAWNIVKPDCPGDGTISARP